MRWRRRRLQSAHSLCSPLFALCLSLGLTPARALHAFLHFAARLHKFRARHLSVYLFLTRFACAGATARDVCGYCCCYSFVCVVVAFALCSFLAFCNCSYLVQQIKQMPKQKQKSNRNNCVNLYKIHIFNLIYISI